MTVNDQQPNRKAAYMFEFLRLCVFKNETPATEQTYSLKIPLSKPQISSVN